MLLKGMSISTRVELTATHRTVKQTKVHGI